MHKIINRQSTSWQLLAIAFPMLLVGISTPMLGMVDTAVVGHLDSADYLGAVALGAMIFNFLFWSLGFLRMSATALTARAIGGEDHKAVYLAVWRGLLVALILGLLIVVLQHVISYIAFSLVESNPHVIALAKEYFSIRVWSAPAVLGSYALLGWFLGQGKAKINLLLVVTGNILNIIFDLLFVVYWNMDVDGVAWATLIAEYSVFSIGLLLVVRSGRNHIRPDWRALFDPAAVRHYLKFNRDIFLRTLFLILCFSFFTISSAKYGEVVLAANAVLMNMQMFLAHVLDSIAHAVEVLVGKSYFKAKQQQLNAYLKVSFYWASGAALCFTGFYIGFGDTIAGLLTDIDEVLLAIEKYLPWIMLSPLLSVWGYWFDGIFIGANLAKFMRNTMFVAMLVFFSVYFLMQSWGNHGLWAALMSFMLTRGVAMAFVVKHKHLFQPRV